MCVEQWCTCGMGWRERAVLGAVWCRWSRREAASAWLHATSTSHRVGSLHVIFRRSKKDKLGNRPEQSKKRAAQAGLEPTTHCLLGRCSPLSYRGSSAGWAESRQYIQRTLESLTPDKQDKLHRYRWRITCYSITTDFCSF